jgi:small subunit ribosomal protein S19
MKNIINKKLFLINKFLLTTSEEIITKSRNLIILPKYLGKTVQIHNGKIFTKVTIVKGMVGHKLGEFAKTRKTFKFKKTNK